MCTGRKAWRKPVQLLCAWCQHLALASVPSFSSVPAETPTVKEGGGSNKVVLLKAIPLLFLHVQIFLCSDCLRLLPHEQHMNAGQYFMCQGEDKRCNSSGGWLTNPLYIHSCYHSILGVGLNAGLNLGVGSLLCLSRNYRAGGNWVLSSLERGREKERGLFLLCSGHLG